MKHPIKTILFLSFLSISACKAETPSIDGIYEVTSPNAMIVLLEEGQKCEAPYHILDTTEDMCVEDVETTDTLVLQKTPEGNLEFAASLAFFNGHSCYIHETAKPHGDGWRFEKDGGEYEQCILDIAVNDTEITFDADETKNCAYYCGARGSLDDTKFLRSTKTGPVANNFACLENDAVSCDK